MSKKIELAKADMSLHSSQFAYDHKVYNVLKGNCLIPEEGLAMIRFHSCYPWHRDGAYRHFMNPGDESLLEAVMEFNPYGTLTTKDIQIQGVAQEYSLCSTDLYSKSAVKPDIDELKPYYQVS